MSDSYPIPREVMGRVMENREVMPGVYLMWLESEFIARAARPGQFVMLGCGEATLLRRPFAVFDINHGRSGFALLYGVVGRGTRWLSYRQVGEELSFMGPLGNGFTIYPSSRRLLLIAGGLGVAPLAFLAKVSQEAGLELGLLLGAASSDQVCPPWLLPSGVTCQVATLDGSQGERGLITDLIDRVNGGVDQVFACGPQGMYVQLWHEGSARDLPVQVSIEVKMGCGVGGCYGCSIRTRQGMKRVCHDGPVFELRDVIF